MNLKTLPIVRHVRYFLALNAVLQHLQIMRSLGMGCVMSRRDEEYLRGVWQGRW